MVGPESAVLHLSQTSLKPAVNDLLLGCQTKYQVIELLLLSTYGLGIIQ